jgi:hypothetical protein
MGLFPQVAHALIGTYIYTWCLYDREMLFRRWVAEHHSDMATPCAVSAPSLPARAPHAVNTLHWWPCLAG